MTPHHPRRPQPDPVPTRFAASRTRRLVSCAVVFLCLLLGAVLPSSVADYQCDPGTDSCPDLCVGMSESLQSSVSVDEPGGAAIPDGGAVPTGTRVRIDSVATAYGECLGMFPEDGECTLLNVQERLVHSINGSKTYDTEELSGTYYSLHVFGISENGTAFWNVLDTTASNSTGPNYVYLTYPGTYTFSLWAAFLPTACNIEPSSLGPVTTTVYAIDEREVNNGPAPCQNVPDGGNAHAAAGPESEGGPVSVGEPVNVATGNMFLQQTDYRLAGLGGGLHLTRTFNSHTKYIGRFGYGWQSSYEDKLTTHGGQQIAWRRDDGRVVYFVQDAASGLFLPNGPLDVRGQLVVNPDSTYTLTMKNGVVRQFDASGQLLSVSDRSGNTTTLTYDASGQLIAITDASGRSLNLSYNANGFVSTISDSVGTVATYTYKAYFLTQQLLSVTYADGYAYQFTYYRDNLTKVKDQLGNVLEQHTYENGDAGRALTSVRDGGVDQLTLTYVSDSETHVTDGLGRLSKYTYATINGRKVVTQVEGDCGCGPSHLNTWTYDGQANVTQRSDADGNTTSFTYDADGNMLTRTDALGNMTSYAYNIFGQVLSRTDALGGVVSNTYDASGNLLTHTDALGNVTTFTYTPEGLPASVSDPRGNVTQLAYDAHGNLIQRTDALGNVTSFTYDPRGNLLTLTDALNNTTTYAYDSRGRLLTVTRPGSTVVTYTYDTLGRLSQVTNANGNSTTYGYDSAYRLTTVTDALSNTTTYGYDVMSNRTAETDALGRTTDYVYDDLNRLIQVIYPEAAPGAGHLDETFNYDTAGNLSAHTDRAGRSTTYAYDALGRRTSMTDPALNTTSFEYDAISRLTALQDALGQRTEWSYDAAGRLIQRLRAGTTTTFAYDAAGNRTQRTDDNGNTTTYTYDVLNRQTSITYPDATTVTYGYDPLSRLTSAGNAQGTVSMQYDSLGRLTSSTDVWGETLTYGYDATSNPTQLQRGPTDTTTYQYDALDRLTQLTDHASRITALAYDAVGRPTSRTLPNGTTATYTFDDLDQLTRLTHALGAVTIDDYQYTLDDTGNRTQRNDLSGTHTYTYDLLDQLTAATHPSQPAENYSYDAVGNRTTSHLSATYGYQASNRLTATDGATYAYDANGNRISKTDGSGTWQYDWDYENRLIQVTRPDSVAISFAYDALGRRVERSASTGEVIRYVWNRDSVIEEQDASGTVLRRYVHTDQIDDLVTLEAQGNAYIYHQDGLNSVGHLTDMSGTVVDSYTTDSFGQTTGAAGTITQPYDFTGRYRDGDTGLMYYRNRWYDSELGRFLSEDPIGFEGEDVNLYRYVYNSPINLIDPFGLDGIYVHYDGYPINTGLGFELPLGHAAVVAVDPKTGSTRYYEYGRYDSNFGQVKRRVIPDVKIGPDGKPTAKSLKNLYDYLSKRYGKKNPVSAEYFDDADFQKIIDFALQRMNDPARRPYSWNPINPNHCKSFAKEAIDAGRN